MDNKKELCSLCLCRKKVKTKDNRTFNAYFAYRLEKTIDGGYTDKLTEVVDTTTGETKLIALPIRVSLLDDIKSTFDKLENFPYRIDLDTQGKTSNDQSKFFVTIDKDKDGVVKLDKNNKKHAVIVIREVEKYEHMDRKGMSLDDIDNIA